MLDDDEEWGDCLDEGLKEQFKVKSLKFKVRR